MRVVVVGAGILELAAARAVLLAEADADVVVIEKEGDVAGHQTSHNSGVVHAGLYYKPGSLKARLCRRGVTLLREYCAEHGIEYEECGKVLVATNETELGRLEEIQQRAEANGVPRVTRVGPSELRTLEPHVTGLGGLHSPTTAIVNYAKVASALRADLSRRGGRVRVGTAVARISDHGTRPELLMADGTEELADRVLVCAGLHADSWPRHPAARPIPGSFPSAASTTRCGRGARRWSGD
jgi:(S)-2-hydroxyglutarate dehydrogenase